MLPLDDRKKILVVEDEGLLADDIRRRLERLGYDVPATASSGEEALRIARTLSFDLILMDIRLKGDMDGITAAQHLRNELRAPVVYLTAHADQDTVSRATLTEPFGYILKPIADSNLRTTVQIALYKHEMERRLRVSEAWLSTTLRSIGEGIIATNPDGDIVFMNAVACRLTGWAPADAQGRALMEVAALLHDHSGEPAPNPIFDLAPDETRCYLLVSRDGTRTPVEAACFENRDDAELLGAILMIRDIRARRDWQALQTQSQRMDAIAALSAGMSGNLHRLLATLSEQVDEMYPLLAPEDRELAARVRQSVSAAAALANQFSALGRCDPPHPQVIDLNQTIRECQDSLAVCLGRNIVLETNLHAATAFVQADRSRFQQVLTNLAVRAREALPEGGRFTIESSILDLDAANPLARRYPNRWYLRLRVADTGPWLDTSTIFEPSFSAGNRFGLSIAHAIVEQAGGFLSAAQGDAGGAVFEILWPCIGTHRGVTGLAGRSDVAIPAVLLVESEDALRRAMCACLEEEGYQVLEAKNAEHAELVAAAFRKPLAVLVVDETGAPLADRLKTPALQLSGYRHDSALGPQSLLKPFPMPEFRRRIRGLVA